jgi:hypothetical protein
MKLIKWPRESEKMIMNEHTLFSELSSGRVLMLHDYCQYFIKCNMSSRLQCSALVSYKVFQFPFILLPLSFLHICKQKNRMNHNIWKLTKENFRVESTPKIYWKCSMSYQYDPCVKIFPVFYLSDTEITLHIN